MPIFGKSKIGDSCFIDSNALIGYPHNTELNLLEENSDKKWGSNQVYMEYKNNTPVLLPSIRRKGLL